MEKGSAIQDVISQAQREIEQARQAGKAPHPTKAVQEAIAAAVRLGMPLESASGLIGLEPETVLKWRDLGADLGPIWGELNAEYRKKGMDFLMFAIRLTFAEDDFIDRNAAIVEAGLEKESRRRRRRPKGGRDPR